MTMNNYKIIISIFISLLVLALGIYWYSAFYNKPVVHNAITIQSCSDINPRTVNVERGEEITFVNNDKADHHFSVGNTSINVPARNNLAIVADFEHSPGTYSLDCDQIPNVLQISILSQSVVGPTQATAPASFQKTYDDMPVAYQACVKSALGNEFDKLYKDSSYNISAAAASKYGKCAPPQPRTGDVSFKSFYDEENTSVKSCLKIALGDEFEKAYEDPVYAMTKEHGQNLVNCLNNN